MTWRATSARPYPVAARQVHLQLLHDGGVRQHVPQGRKWNLKAKFKSGSSHSSIADTVPSAVNKGSTWGQYGVNLMSTWIQAGVDLASTWGQPGVKLSSTRGQPGVNLGSIWGQPGVNLGSTWVQPEFNLGSTWVQPEFNLGSTWGQPAPPYRAAAGRSANTAGRWSSSLWPTRCAPRSPPAPR